MSKAIPMIHRKFGNLTVLKEAEGSKGHRRWVCRCDCGKDVIVDGGNLRSGHSASCGGCQKYVEINDSIMRCDLPNGQSFLFSREDFSKIARHKWSIENSGYVHTTIDGKHIRLHRYLVGKSDQSVDHINGCRTDNRRENLRYVSNQKNCWNAGLAAHNTSGYKGVSFCKARGKFEAKIMIDYQSKFLGYYDSPIEAALAYDKAAAFYFGEYARTNFGKEAHYEGPKKVLEVDQPDRTGQSRRACS